MKKITVFGATGMLGKPVTQELIQSGFSVTALVRDKDKARKLFPAGAAFVSGSLDEKEAIRESLTGAQGVYISIANGYQDREGAFTAEGQGLDNILAVAVELKIQQVILLSSFHARNYSGNWWFYKVKHSCIERVKASGLPYTIFYAAPFMENFHNGMIRGSKVATLKHRQANRSYWIAGADFAKQVAVAFKSQTALNKEYPTQGPEVFTMEEAAKEFTDNYSKKVLTVGSMPLLLLKIIGLFSPEIRFMARLSEISAATNETFEAQETWNELGPPTVTIAKYAKEN